MNFDSGEIDFELNNLGRHSSEFKESVVKELVLNASDAIMLRAICDRTFSEIKGLIDITIEFGNSSLSIADNGIGLTLNQLEVLFQPIALSSTALRKGKIDEENGISGNLFFSAFELADVIEISTKAWQGDEPAIHAVLNAANGRIALSHECNKNEPGTLINLHLNSVGKVLLNPEIIKNIITRNCRYVKYPITLNNQIIHSPNTPIIVDNNDFMRQVADILTKAGFRFEIEPPIGGLRPDFLIYGDEGQMLVLEAKVWASKPGILERALAQSEYYKKITGADAALVVLANSCQSVPREGIINLDSLVSVINEKLKEVPSKCHKSKSLTDNNAIIFAAMPFSADYDDVYFVAMAYAAEQVNATCVRVDQEEFSGDIVVKIQEYINNCIAVIADLSESRPNVLYEVGYAHALNLPVVHICSTPLEQLPFDVRNWNTISYIHGQTFKLKDKLAQRLKALLLIT